MIEVKRVVDIDESIVYIKDVLKALHVLAIPYSIERLIGQ